MELWETVGKEGREGEGELYSGQVVRRSLCRINLICYSVVYCKLETAEDADNNNGHKSMN